MHHLSKVTILSFSFEYLSLRFDTNSHYYLYLTETENKADLKQNETCYVLIYNDRSAELVIHCIVVKQGCSSKLQFLRSSVAGSHAALHFSVL